MRWEEPTGVQEEKKKLQLNEKLTHWMTTMRNLRRFARVLRPSPQSVRRCQTHERWDEVKFIIMIRANEFQFIFHTRLLAFRLPLSEETTMMPRREKSESERHFRSMKNNVATTLRLWLWLSCSRASSSSRHKTNIFSSLNGERKMQERRRISSTFFIVIPFAFSSSLSHPSLLSQSKGNTQRQRRREDMKVKNFHCKKKKQKKKCKKISLSTAALWLNALIVNSALSGMIKYHLIVW